MGYKNLSLLFFIPYPLFHYFSSFSPYIDDIAHVVVIQIKLNILKNKPFSKTYEMLVLLQMIRKVCKIRSPCLVCIIILISNFNNCISIVFLKLVVTPNGGSTKTNTTDIYMNGNKIATAENLNEKTVIDGIQFHAENQSLITYWIDDVEVWAGEYLADIY